MPWAAAPRDLRARAERPLFVHIFINDLLLWYLSTAASSMASLGFLRPREAPSLQACLVRRMPLCAQRTAISNRRSRVNSRSALIDLAAQRAANGPLEREK